MRGGLAMGTAAILATMFAGSAPMASGAELGRLAAFSARQGLRDRVCFAMADGHIDRGERYAILTRAKGILKPEEYEALKRAMDRLSPSSPTTSQSSLRTRSNEPQGLAGHGALRIARRPLAPSLPTGTVLPDTVASGDDAR